MSDHNTSCNDRYETICRQEFETLNEKLDRIDVALRGNGVTGIQTRLDRLERAEEIRSRLIWIIIVAVAGLIARTVFGS